MTPVNEKCMPTVGQKMTIRTMRWDDGWEFDCPVVIVKFDPPHVAKLFESKILLVRCGSSNKRGQVLLR